MIFPVLIFIHFLNLLQWIAEQFNNSMEFIKEKALNGIVHDGLFVRSSDTNGIGNYLKVNGFMD